MATHSPWTARAIANAHVSAVRSSVPRRTYTFLVILRLALCLKLVELVRLLLRRPTRRVRAFAGQKQGKCRARK